MCKFANMKAELLTSKICSWNFSFSIGIRRESEVHDCNRYGPPGHLHLWVSVGHLGRRDSQAKSMLSLEQSPQDHNWRSGASSAAARTSWTCLHLLGYSTDRYPLPGTPAYSSGTCRGKMSRELYGHFKKYCCALSSWATKYFLLRWLWSWSTAL